MSTPQDKLQQIMQQKLDKKKKQGQMGPGSTPTNPFPIKGGGPVPLSPQKPAPTQKPTPGYMYGPERQRMRLPIDSLRRDQKVQGEIRRAFESIQQDPRSRKKGPQPEEPQPADHQIPEKTYPGTRPMPPQKGFKEQIINQEQQIEKKSPSMIRVEGSNHKDLWNKITNPYAKDINDAAQNGFAKPMPQNRRNSDPGFDKKPYPQKGPDPRQRQIPEKPTQMSPKVDYRKRWNDMNQYNIKKKGL